MIAMNPASELGGYPVPDLRLCSRVSWSFHAYCAFDTLRTLADATILLETRDDATELAKHTIGITRLTERLAQGDLDWTAAERELPENEAESSRVLATFDGRLTEIDLPRIWTRPDQCRFRWRSMIRDFNLQSSRSDSAAATAQCYTQGREF